MIVVFVFFPLSHLAICCILVCGIIRHIDKITYRVTVGHVGSGRSLDLHVRRRLGVMKELCVMR